MPTYVWKCAKHGEFETISKMADKPDLAPCPECQNPSMQLPVYGGVQSDEPSWLFERETLGSLQKPGEKPIESRTEFKRYLRDNNIVERG